MEEGQITWRGWRKARSLGVDGGGPGHLTWMEKVRLLKTVKMVNSQAAGKDHNKDGKTAPSEKGRGE